MVEESCITFFWLGTLATARDAASIWFICILWSGGGLQDTENLARCFAFLLYYIISSLLQRCYNNIMPSHLVAVIILQQSVITKHVCPDLVPTCTRCIHYNKFQTKFSLCNSTAPILRRR